GGTATGSPATEGRPCACEVCPSTGTGCPSPWPVCGDSRLDLPDPLPPGHRRRHL
ncbi:MAG: hypothetical protein AVDCRST_MAG61-2152, partial [uncultured Friedmanniella sp.]